MGKKVSQLLVLLIAILIVLSPDAAKADSTLDQIQITCSKDLNYFSLHTFRLQDRHEFPSAEEVSRQENQGLFSVKSLREHPYKCDTGEAIISIEVTHYRPACVVDQRFALLIRQNGNEVYEFDAYGGDDSCASPDTHFIEMLEPANKYSLKDCLVPDGKGQMSCSYPAK